MPYAMLVLLLMAALFSLPIGLPTSTEIAQSLATNMAITFDAAVSHVTATGASGSLTMIALPAGYGPARDWQSEHHGNLIITWYKPVLDANAHTLFRQLTALRPGAAVMQPASGSAVADNGAAYALPSTIPAGAVALVSQIGTAS